jgi:AAA15 family ATPase/GTPase
MNLLRTIKINNFRGFNNLEIEGFNQINLLIGKNNSGKTSLLEALFLLIGMSNPSLPDTINLFRGINILNINGLRYIFHKFKLNNKPQLEGTFSDTSTRLLVLDPIFSKEGSEFESQKTKNVEFSIDASTSSPILTGLDLLFQIKGKNNSKKIYKSSVFLKNNERVRKLDNTYKEELQAVYISGKSDEAGAIPRYSEILKNKKEDIVLSSLKKIDPKIVSIHLLVDGLYINYEDIEELMPSNIAGDGIRKYLNIVTTIAEKKNNIVLIDEIENGLHFSAHKFLWESIITISKDLNVQLFITTHSIETIKCLKELLETEKYINCQKMLSVFDLSHTKIGGIKAYKYSFKGLKDAIETETEIRE